MPWSAARLSAAACCTVNGAVCECRTRRPARRAKGRMSELRPAAWVIAAVGNHLPPDAWGAGRRGRPVGGAARTPGGAGRPSPGAGAALLTFFAAASRAPEVADGPTVDCKVTHLDLPALPKGIHLCPSAQAVRAQNHQRDHGPDGAPSPGHVPSLLGDGSACTSRSKNNTIRSTPGKRFRQQIPGRPGRPPGVAFPFSRRDNTRAQPSITLARRGRTMRRSKLRARVLLTTGLGGWRSLQHRLGPRSHCRRS